MTKPQHDPLSEDEIAMMVALHHGNEPSPEDPLCKALEARGLSPGARQNQPGNSRRRASTTSPSSARPRPSDGHDAWVSLAVPHAC